MKMPTPPKPTTEELELFAETIRQAGRAGIHATKALSGNRPVGKWLESLRDFLPPELVALGLRCTKVHRGYSYFASDEPKANAPTRVAGQIRARANAQRDRDSAWFASQVELLEWSRLLDRIAASPDGRISAHDLLEPIAGQDIAKAILYHRNPYRLPPELARLGVAYDPTGQGSYFVEF
jgi:hypothetical protein